ncbi:MAG: hypothetical protein EXS12_03950 [Phycisphaerales bacterium]|nr:hypothetical protein [Phycisphaerales bacterium]
MCCEGVSDGVFLGSIGSTTCQSCRNMRRFVAGASGVRFPKYSRNGDIARGN